MELNFDCFEKDLGQGFTRLFFKITNYSLWLDRGGWYGPNHCILQNFTASFIYRVAKHFFELTKTWFLSCSKMAIFDILLNFLKVYLKYQVWSCLQLLYEQ